MDRLSVTVGKFRLTNISRISVGYFDIKEGIALEKESPIGCGWSVLAFIRFKAKTGEAFYECIGTRLTDNVDASEWPIVAGLLECGVKIVETANRELNDQFIGMQPSDKATDFDSVIQWFDPTHPSQSWSVDKW